MTNHLLAAAKLARSAAHHAAAAGDRAAYWGLLAQTEYLGGDPELGDRFDSLSIKYKTGLLLPPA